VALVAYQGEDAILFIDKDTLPDDYYVEHLRFAGDLDFL
jgi:hypothetical protein